MPVLRELTLHFFVTYNQQCGNERNTVAPSRVRQSPPGESRPREGATACVEDRHLRGHLMPEVAAP